MDPAKVDEFLRVRGHLRTHRAKLADAASPSDGAWRVLAPDGWIPSRPLRLDEIRLSLREASADEDLEPARRRVASETGISGYARAVGELDRPGIWFDAPIYRLVGVEPAADETLGFAFTMARYFDAQDTNEPLIYEAMRRDLEGDADVLGGPYRKWLGDPFDFRRRCALLGISTLTVRSGATGASFLMHRRSVGGVGVSMNALHVVPAGEFQPHADIPAIWKADLSIAKAVVREYAEELLGAPDAAGVEGATVDDDRDEPHATLTRALADGSATLHVLGAVLDPLSWKAEILTVCVWDSEAFETVFEAMREENEEGVLVLGERRASGGYAGIPFSETAVADRVHDRSTLSVASACLALTWRWRKQLGIVEIPS